MHADRGEGEEEHGAELVVGALQAHGGGGEGGAAAEAVEPHVRLDELVLAQLGHLRLGEFKTLVKTLFPDDDQARLFGEPSLLSFSRFGVQRGGVSLQLYFDYGKV